MDSLCWMDDLEAGTQGRRETEDLSSSLRRSEQETVGHGNMRTHKQKTYAYPVQQCVSIVTKVWSHVSVYLKPSVMI